MGAAVTRVANVVVTNSDAGAVGLQILGAVLADHLCVGDLLLLVAGDIIEVYHMESVCTLHALLGRVCGTGAHPLAKVSKFIGIRRGPNAFILGMSLELAVLKCEASFMVKDWCREVR